MQCCESSLTVFSIESADSQLEMNILSLVSESPSRSEELGEVERRVAPDMAGLETISLGLG